MATATDLSRYAAVVTGGARGIGYACAARLLRAGAAVTIWDVDRAALEAAAAKLKRDGSVLAHLADVSDAASVEAASRETVRAMGKVDILINNAGITGPNKKTWEYPPDEWRRVIEVDLIGPYLCARALVPGMMALGYGRIVNIASIAGKEVILTLRRTAPRKPASSV